MHTREEIAAAQDELLLDGLIEFTGEFRNGQPVLMLSDKGRVLFESLSSDDRS